MSITQTQTQNQKLKTTLGELSYQIVEPILKKNQDLKAEVKRLKRSFNPFQIGQNNRDLKEVVMRLKNEVKRLKAKVNRLVDSHKINKDALAVAVERASELNKWKDAFDDGTRFTCADCECNCGRLVDRFGNDNIELNYDGDEICESCAFDIVMDKDGIQQNYFGVMEEMVKGVMLGDLRICFKPLND